MPRLRPPLFKKKEEREGKRGRRERARCTGVSSAQARRRNTTPGPQKLWFSYSYSSVLVLLVDWFFLSRKEASAGAKRLIVVWVRSSRVRRRGE